VLPLVPIVRLKLVARATAPPGVHGHRTYTCRYPVNGSECGLVLSFPPCRDPTAGPASWV